MTQLRAVNTVEPAGVRAEPLLVPILVGWRKVEYLAGVAVWFVALVHFWTWWLTPAHHVDLFGSVLVTATLAWVTLLPVYFLAVFYRASKPAGPLRTPGWQSHRDGRDQGPLRTVRGRGRDFGCDARPGRAARHLASRRGSVA